MTQLALMEFDGAKKWRRQRRRPSAEGDMGCARGEERRKNEEENMGKNIQRANNPWSLTLWQIMMYNENNSK